MSTPQSQSSGDDRQKVQQAFALLVQAERTRTGCDRRTAIARVARREPGLHALYQAALPNVGPRLGKK